ncbi:helicase-associated domain-containing protein [Pseudonocardia lacus]|uniref:helicase-associated domain-containing protein n=1 Tax=Pseudonocardia lacus TaxID=2835865 RepID=UPI001BDD381B|nr:helicase-associated domain-containing protein [Pseudonocardia lacus]
MSLTDHLAGLDAEPLVDLLEARPDVLVEPVPRDHRELAARLTGADSVGRALTRMNRDEMAVARAIAVRGQASAAELVAELGADADVVGAVLAGMCARGLAWPDGDGRFEVPAVLVEHFFVALAPFRPLDAIAHSAGVGDLRTALSGLGGNPTGLTKAAVVEALRTLFRDPAVVRAAAARLPGHARALLDVYLRTGFAGFGIGAAGADPWQPLVRAGLLIDGPRGRIELPREVAVALTSGYGGVSGPPRLPPAAGEQQSGRPAAESALLALTSLLDEAAAAPLRALKNGGVGVREQRKLAARLGVSDPGLWIDLAAELDLLGPVEDGCYPATATYHEWRERPPARRWAGAVLAWFRLDHAPTSRHVPGRDVPPPLPLGASDWMPRRALLTAASGGRSLDAVAAAMAWFCPLYDEPGESVVEDIDEYGRTFTDRYAGEGADDEPPIGDDVLRRIAVDHARPEAERLGLVAGDRLTDLGELLVEVVDRPDAEDALAARAADLLPETAGLLVLQSDLTAVVSGQPSAAAARVLAAAAVPESRGVATTWRFGAAGVRAAMDAGWTAADLRAQLIEVSGAELPQPLDYLLSDVARRHGTVRVHTCTTCLTGAEAELEEVLATRALRGLSLRRLAPTVLVSDAQADQLLAALRGAGFSPMPADGGVVLTRGGGGQGRPVERRPAGPRRVGRARVPAAELVEALRNAPARPAPLPPAQRELARSARHLDAAALALLADAVEHGRDVRIQYRNRAGNRTLRDIRPHHTDGAYVLAWCHLRGGEREFAVRGIEAVGLVD